jgi:tetratricopeptide (TPR) repeat protein
MKEKKRIYRFVSALGLLAFLAILQSCQNDARTATRIPPVVKKTRAQSQDDALQSLSDLINRNIDSDLNYFKRAKIYFEKDLYSEALADINEAIDEKDNVGDYFLMRGQIHRELNEIDQALEDAQRAEALQQNTPALFVLLADIFQEKKQFRESVKYLNQVMMIAPYDGTAYYVKGMLLARQGDSLACLTSLQTAVNLNPHLLRAYQQSTAIQLKLSQFDQALLSNSRAIRRFPARAELYSMRGEIYQTLAKPDTALMNYEKAVSLDRKNIDVLFKIVNINLLLRQYYKAIVALEQVQKINPAHKQINFLMGYCYEKSGNFPKAREYYTTAFAKDPTDLQSRYGLWRTRNRDSEYNSELYSEGSQGGDYRLLDTSRVKINMIQPRGTTNLTIDSTRKAKIE